MWIKVLVASGALVTAVACGDPRTTSVTPLQPAHTAAASQTDADAIASLYPQCRQLGSCATIGQLVRTECDATDDQRAAFLGSLTDQSADIASQYLAELAAVCPDVR